VRLAGAGGSVKPRPHWATIVAEMGDSPVWTGLIKAAKSDRSGNGWLLIAPCRLLVLVSTPLRIVNRCCSGFPVSGGKQMSGPFRPTFNIYS